MEPNNDEKKAPSTNTSRISAEKACPIGRDQKLSGRAFEPPPDRDNFVGFRPQYFFFYGSLMDARQLRKILQLRETPVLQPASIVGWDIMLWGQYPALIFKVNNITHGMAYEVQKEEHVEYLKRYETDVYMVNGCNIKLAAGRQLAGKTFIWNAGKELLKKGKFDLKDWQMDQLENSMEDNAHPRPRYIGGAAGGTLTFPAISSTAATTSTIRIYHTNGDSSQRYASVIVNGPGYIVAFCPNGGDTSPSKNGSNFIEFEAPHVGWAPNIDRLMVLVS